MQKTILSRHQLTHNRPRMKECDSECARKNLAVGVGEWTLIVSLRDRAVGLFPTPMHCQCYSRIVLAWLLSKLAMNENGDFPSSLNSERTTAYRWSRGPLHSEDVLPARPNRCDRWALPNIGILHKPRGAPSLRPTIVRAGVYNRLFDRVEANQDGLCFSHLGVLIRLTTANG